MLPLFDRIGNSLGDPGEVLSDTFNLLPNGGKARAPLEKPGIDAEDLVRVHKEKAHHQQLQNQQGEESAAGERRLRLKPIGLG